MKRNRVPSNHDESWNSLPYEERCRLMPNAIESQLRHIAKCKEKAIKHHKSHMKELDNWSDNLLRELRQNNQLSTLASLSGLFMSAICR